MSTIVPTMLTIAETAKRTGLSYNNIRQLCLNNEIVYIKAGTKYLINFDKFVDYLNGAA
jgi:DNA binding domain, excisionase family